MSNEKEITCRIEFNPNVEKDKVKVEFNLIEVSILNWSAKLFLEQMNEDHPDYNENVESIFGIIKKTAEARNYLLEKNIEVKRGSDN